MYEKRTALVSKTRERVNLAWTPAAKIHDKRLNTPNSKSMIIVIVIVIGAGLLGFVAITFSWRHKAWYPKICGHSRTIGVHLEDLAFGTRLINISPAIIN